MSPPPRARSGTGRRMGSESPPGSAGPPPWSMESRRPILKPRRAAVGSSSASSTTRAAGRPSRPSSRAGRPAPRARAGRATGGGDGARRHPAASGPGARAPRCEQRARGLELRARRTALPDEICVIGVREPVRVGAQPGNEGPLLEPEHGLALRPRPRETPRSHPSSSRRRRSASRGRSRACERRRPTRRCGRTPRLRAAASAPRDAASAARSASPPRGRRRAGRPPGSRRGRRRVRAAGRAAGRSRPSTPASVRTSIVCGEPSTRSCVRALRSNA